MLAMLLLAWLVPLHFSTVDDVEMEGIASGALTGQPEFRLVFIHAFVGKILQALYTWMPLASWYGGFFLLCHGFALALMITLVRHVTPVAGIASTAIGVTLHFYCLSDLQFTTTACLLGAWATMWLWKLATRPAFRLNDWMWLWSVLGLLLAWMLRKEAVAFALIALAPMFLLLFSRDRASWLARMAMPTLALGLVFALFYIDQKMQFDAPEWKSFNTYNLRRALLQDASLFHYDAFKDEAARVGWSSADFVLFDEFLSDGAPPFTLDKLEMLHTEASPRFNKQVNWEGIGTQFRDMFRFSRYLLLVSVLIGAAALLAGRRSWSLWPMLAITVTLLVVQGHYFGSKDRLIVAALVQCGVAALAFLAVYGEDAILTFHPTRRGKAMLLSFLGLAAAGFSARANLVNARIKHDTIAQHLAAISTRVADQADNKVLVNVDAYPSLVNDPFHLLQKPRAGYTAFVVPLGWLAGSPYQKKIMKDAGLNPDSSALMQLLSGRQRFFMGTATQAGMVKDYLETHTRQPMDTASIGPFPYFHGLELRVFKFRGKNLEGISEKE